MKIIDLQDFEIVSGAFADVLVDTNSKRALKLFKSYDHPTLNRTGNEEVGPEKTNKYRRKVFETEFEAYGLVQKSDILKKHTPNFYGQITLDNVLNEDQDASLYYLMDCCFEMEYVHGECEKLHLIDNAILQEVERSLKFNLTSLICEFVKAGINYTLDSSAIMNSQKFTIIDFATTDPCEFEPVIGMD